jgi:hypothetical protein
MPHARARSKSVVAVVILAAGAGGVFVAGAMVPRALAANPPAVPANAPTLTAPTATVVPTATVPPHFPLWSVTADGSGINGSLPSGHFLNWTENFFVQFTGVGLYPGTAGVWMVPQSLANIVTTQAQANAALPPGNYKLSINVANGTHAQPLSVYGTAPGGQGGLPANAALITTCNLPASDAYFQTVNTCAVTLQPVGGQISVNIQVGFSAIFKSATLTPQ